jgi:hypothetical protein
MSGGRGPDDVALADIAGRHLVIEQEIDGANSVFSFAADGTLLQSRGHSGRSALRVGPARAAQGGRAPEVRC